MESLEGPIPQSYELRVGASVIDLLTKEGAQYNIAMETTGLSLVLVKSGLTAPLYANYHKLVVLVEIDDVETAKTIVHSRLIKVMNTNRLLGGDNLELTWTSSAKRQERHLQFANS